MKLNRARRSFSALLVLAGLMLLAGGALSASRVAMVITINGAINPVVAEYAAGAIQSANASPDVELLVIEMDTPGGLDTSMRQIIKEIQGSSKPVVTYVSPSGSRAASAGAFIAIASHVAAMAPGANIGSASPVSMAGEGMDRTMKKKVTNDAAAYIRSLAEAHGRNADWAEKFVTQSANLTETEAVKEKVVDLVADNLGALLSALDGRVVKTAGGAQTIKSKGLRVKRVEMNFRQKIFNALADPNIAYILMMLGFYGLFFELSNPGAIFPGVIGAICLILAFYSLQTLPINYAGALLILLAIILFLLEIKVPSYGALTIGGIVALVIGSMMLVDTPEEYLRLSLSVILPTAVLTGAFFFFLVGSALRIHRRASPAGREGLIGAEGVAETDLAAGTAGRVFVTGELWDARLTAGQVPPGARVVVTDVRGLTLTVRPADETPAKGA
ncbi:MAG: nodulation protein NfeD [Nitrospinae bacterium]|nr:nodulation protein NfeD [Nitrospinota bacterium]